MKYYVFTTYPDKPSQHQFPSNNPHYIGMVTNKKELKKLGSLLYPDLFVSSVYRSKQDAEKFIQKIWNETPHYKVYERMTVMSDKYLSLHNLPLGTVTIESRNYNNQKT